MSIYTWFTGWGRALFDVGRVRRSSGVDGAEFKPAKAGLASKAVVLDSCTGCEACLWVQPRYDPRSGKIVMADDVRADALPKIGCLVSLVRIDPDGPSAGPQRKIAVNFDACVGCGYCEKICSGQSIGGGKYEAVIWNAIEVKKGAELEALAAPGESDTEPYYFAGQVTVFHKTTAYGKPRSEEIDGILLAHQFPVDKHPGAATADLAVREVYFRETGGIAKYRMDPGNTYDPATRTTVVLHDAIRALFAGEDLETVRARYPRYEIRVQEV